MQYRLLIPCIFAILSLSACGQLEKFQRFPANGQTEVRISGERSRDSVSINAWATAGILVYAQNVNEPQRRGARFMPNEDTAVSWAIPNGRYRFLAVGYDATAANAIKCGVSEIFDLTGSFVNVTMHLTSAACADTVNFQSAASFSGTQPFPLTIVSCTNNTGILSDAAFSAKTAGGNCVSTQAGAHLGFRVSVPEFNAFDGVVDVAQNGALEVESGCFNTGGTAGAPATSTFKVPLGGSATSPFLYGVTAYTDVGCTASAGKRVYGFTKGIAAANNSNMIFFDTSSGSDLQLAPANTPMANVIMSNPNTLFLRSF